MRSGKNIRLSETLGERYVVAARSLAAAVLFLAFPLLSFSQNIVFPDRQVSLAQAMDEIERQTGYTFAYNEGTVDMRRTVTFRSGRIQLRKVMDRLTEGSGLEYEIIGSQIILFPQSGEQGKEAVSLGGDDKAVEKLDIVGNDFQAILFGHLTDYGSQTLASGKASGVFFKKFFHAGKVTNLNILKAGHVYHVHAFGRCPRTKSRLRTIVKNHLNFPSGSRYEEAVHIRHPAFTS